MNFIFNIIKLFFIVVLCFYAVFKPVDIEIHGVSPLFGKCFKIFENNCIIILFVKFGAYQEDFFEEYNKDSPGISSVSKDSPCSSANKESPGILPRAHPSSFKINLVNLGSDNSPNNNVGNSSCIFFFH